MNPLNPDAAASSDQKLETLNIWFVNIKSTKNILVKTWLTYFWKNKLF